MGDVIAAQPGFFVVTAKADGGLRIDPVIGWDVAVLMATPIGAEWPTPVDYVLRTPYSTQTDEDLIKYFNNLAAARAEVATMVKADADAAAAQAADLVAAKEAVVP